MTAREALAEMQTGADECLNDAASSNDLQVWIEAIEAELPSEAEKRFMEAAITHCQWPSPEAFKELHLIFAILMHEKAEREASR